MAYSVSSITTLAEIPALWSAFATAQGFIVDTTSPAQPTVKHPSQAGAEAFKMVVTLAGLNHDVTLSSVSAVATSTAVTRSPILRPSGTTDVTSIPTKLHLFGGLSPKPYLAGVIEYGYNLYRHFYFGHAEQLSAYDGGEIITGSTQGISTSYAGYPFHFNNAAHRAFPFGALCLHAAPGFNGGMRLTHAGNAVPWRTFKHSRTMTADNIDTTFSTDGANIVLGGLGDSVNSGFPLAGKSAFSGANILSPINLYIGKRVSSQQYFQAVGRPAGVRLVNMEDLEPGAEITVGSTVWRVFPVFAKSSDMYLRTIAVTGSAYPTANSSWFYGQAYLVSE